MREQTLNPMNITNPRPDSLTPSPVIQNADAMYLTPSPQGLGFSEPLPPHAQNEAQSVTKSSKPGAPKSFPDEYSVHPRMTRHSWRSLSKPLKLGIPAYTYNPFKGTRGLNVTSQSHLHLIVHHFAACIHACRHCKPYPRV